MIKSRPTNPHLSEHGRKLLQAINAANKPKPEYHNGVLEFDSETGQWWRAGKRIKKETAEEVEKLCAIKTIPDTVWPIIGYVVSDEGNKLLTMPDYVPVMKRPREARAIA